MRTRRSGRWLPRQPRLGARMCQRHILFYASDKKCRNHCDVYLHAVRKRVDAMYLPGQGKPAVQLGVASLIQDLLPDTQGHLPVVGQGLQDAFRFPSRNPVGVRCIIEQRIIVVCHLNSSLSVERRYHTNPDKSSKIMEKTKADRERQEGKRTG